MVEGGVGWALAAGGLHPLVALVGGLLTSEVVKPLYYEFVPDHRLDDYTPELISKRITTRVNESLKALIPENFEVRTRERVFGAGLVVDNNFTLIMLTGGEESEVFGIYSSHSVFAAMASSYFDSLWQDSDVVK